MTEMYDTVTEVTTAPYSSFLDAYSVAASDALIEVHHARTMFPEMYSAHEGFAIILEEMDELKAHVWMKQSKRDLAAMRKEAIQVAAMAISFAVDVCNEARGRR